MSQSTIPGDGSAQGPRRYRDLADWYPLLTQVGDYAEEAGRSSNCDGGHEMFLGLRPDGPQAGERR